MTWRLSTRDGGTRPLAAVPKVVRALFLGALLVHVSWSHTRPPAVATAQSLPVAPDARLLRLAALGEPVTAARILMLWLQAFDDQPGVSIPFARLDYARVISWLDALLELDARFQYPLLSASRVYTATPDQGKKRQMLEFVHRRFLEDPDRRWPWMVHGVHVARRRVGDLRLALQYAEALRVNVRADTAPPWVLQLEIVILEELGEPGSARLIIGDLLASDRLAGNDNALRFLENRLEQLQGRL